MLLRNPSEKLTYRKVKVTVKKHNRFFKGKSIKALSFKQPSVLVMVPKR